MMGLLATETGRRKFFRCDDGIEAYGDVRRPKVADKPRKSGLIVDFYLKVGCWCRPLPGRGRAREIF